ncbi:MAG: putative baseplate assembly protein [Symploca sp. SIO1B1]|nr:putative baseplate assembly protein [Symploca sp. SIO1B1]
MTSTSENQPEAIYNRPGLSSLSYRIARHDDSLKRMLALLYTQTVPPNDKNGSRPLAKLTTSHQDDPAIAFLDSWATVMEVLTFYQERIANEGFVNTATERLSVLELSRTVGYELDPGVAASTYLAFTIEESDDVPEIVQVPEGVRVESVPIADEQPQVFETIEALEMRGAWNLLQPLLPSETVPQVIGEDTVSLKLSGTETQLGEGDPILVVEEQIEAVESLYTKLTTVETDEELDYTTVAWEPGLGWEPRGQIQVFALREQATLFGNEVSEWKELSPEEQRLYGDDTGGIFNYIDHQEWQSISTGLLKNADVRALVRESNSGSLLVGTNNGIFRSRDGGTNWVEINKGLTNLDIYSLAVNEKGYIFAGATQGNVFRSIDLGESWVENGSGGVSLVEHTITKDGQDDENPEHAWTSIQTSLPSSIIRCLAAYGNTIYAGTEYGIFCSQDSGKTWEDINNVNAEVASGLSVTVVYSIVRIEYINSEVDNPPLEQAQITVEKAQITVEKAQITVEQTQTTPVNEEILIEEAEKTVTEAKKTVTEARKTVRQAKGEIQYIFVGTDQGVFRTGNNGEDWEEINSGMNESPPSVYSLVPVDIDSIIYLFAGTNTGIFLSQNAFNEPATSVSWTEKNEGMTSGATVYSLSIASNAGNHYIYAGTDKGVFRSQVDTSPLEVNWVEINNGLINQEIRSILAYFDATQVEKLLAGSWFDSLYTKEWPGFAIANQQHIDLNGIYDNIFPGSWVVLKHEESNQAYQVKSVATVLHNEFGENSKITRLQLAITKDLTAFGAEKYRETVVLAQSEVLELYEEIIYYTKLPVEGDEIELEQVVPGLEEERKIIISGKQMRAQIPPMGGVARQSLLSDKIWANLTQLWTPTDVHDLLINEEDNRETLFAGTATGVLHLELGSNIWDELDDTEALENIAALESYDLNGTLYILAGRQEGIYRQELGERNWEILPNEGLSNTNIKALEIYTEKGDRYLLAGTEEGLFRLNLDQVDAVWENLTNDLGPTNVLAITTYAERGVRTIFVGTTEGDIFSFKSDRQSWIKFDNRIPNIASVMALATYTLRGDRYLWAGTELGVFRLKLGENAWEEFNTDLDNQQVQALEIYQDSGDISLLAGTNTGIFGRDIQDLTASWHQFSNSWNGDKIVISVKTYDYNDRRYILIATETGQIFSRDLGGNSWHKLEDEGLTNTDVRSLKIDTQYSDKYLLAGTAGGIFRQELNQEKIWKRFDNGLTNTDVYVLEIYEQKSSSYILAGTAEKVSRRKLDNPDEIWHDLSKGWSDREVRALKVYHTQDGRNYILAGTSDGIFYLNLNESNESWSYLNNDGTENDLPDKDVRTLEIEQQEGRDYIWVGTESGVFRSLLNSDQDDQVQKSNLRLATAAILFGDLQLLSFVEIASLSTPKNLDISSWESENTALTNNDVYSLASYRQDNLTWLFAGTSGGNIYRRNLSQEDSEWKQIRQALANDVRAIAISNQGQVFIGTRDHCILKGIESIESQEILPGDSLSILQREELTLDNTLNAMPSHQVVDPGSLVRWQLIDQLGFKGEITTQPGEIPLEAAAEADKILSEVASLKEITHGQQYTKIKLETPLINTYDRTTVTINANVALVTHGEAVSDEVLGSGDGSKGNQEFFLKNPPLTYVPADTASGSESTLSVRVDGLLWEEVTSLEQLTSPEQRYMTRIDDDGKTRIIFGDGYKGARPTTGEENITATYRTGIGPEGEVAANTITLVQSAPLGVVEVTNPQGATGASAPETRDEARQNAPLKTLSLDRIISLQDYEYFIGGFSGIGKVKATQLQTDQNYGMVQATIAGRNGVPVAPDSNLYTQIKDAVEEARDPTLSLGSGPAAEFSLDSYQRLLFNIKARLWLDQRYVVDTVLSDVKEALQEAFTFERRAFAQDVTAAEILQLIQSIPGVDGVDLDALYLDGDDQQFNKFLEAKEASWNGLEVEPAQLLLLNPASGSIELELAE